MSACLLFPLMPPDKIIRDGMHFLMQALRISCVSFSDALGVNGSSESRHGMNPVFLRTSELRSLRAKGVPLATAPGPSEFCPMLSLTPLLEPQLTWRGPPNHSVYTSLCHWGWPLFLALQVSLSGVWL